MSTVPETTHTQFPENPQHGDLFELKPGLLYQWDARVNSWVQIVSSSVALELATPVRKGAMSSLDLKKLNRLVLPPPQSSLVGNDCIAPFQRGTIEFYSGDNFVDVQGNVDIRNIDEFGDEISESNPFHIHQHTYGFDFTLDLPRLIRELIERDQILLQGLPGDKGLKGEEGDPGIDEILAGPKGALGEQGNAPPCELTLDPEPVSAEKRPGLKRALVNARILDHATDRTKYILEFDRQVIGSEDASTTEFNARSSSSFWVLAVASITGDPQPVYYLDIEPIIDAVRQKFLSEVDRLKMGYEDIVEFWIQTMSDLFDEQKAALCCALEYCMSVRKSIDMRQHMESVAASAIGANGAKINLHGRNSGQAEEISHTRILARMPDGEDLCEGGPQFPRNPAAGGGGASAASQASEAEVQTLSAPQTVTIDPLLNVATIRTAASIELPRGRYAATIRNMDTRVGGKYGVTIRIQHTDNGGKKVAQFLDKGRFDSLTDAKSAYEGLSLAFNHDGGEIYIYFPIMPTPDASGNAVISIEPTGFTRQAAPAAPQSVQVTKKPEKKKRWTPPKVEVVDVQEEEIVPFTCSMSVAHLNWYQKGWETGNCCGLVVNVGGQDYIVFKRSIGDDDACGGGESDSTPCISSAKELLGQHPAFAWPTFDKSTFAPIPSGDSVQFRFDEAMNQAVQRKIEKSEYDNQKGNPAGYRHLAYQLSAVLFPAS